MVDPIAARDSHQRAIHIIKGVGENQAGRSWQNADRDQQSSGKKQLSHACYEAVLIPKGGLSLLLGRVSKKRDRVNPKAMWKSARTGAFLRIGKRSKGRFGTPLGPEHLTNVGK